MTVPAPEGVFAQQFGSGPRPALMIHCALARSSAFAPLAAELENEITATAFDLPGHGRSADWDGKSDYFDLAAAQARALLGAGPCDLIGHSFGGVTALRLAIEQPEAVRSLTLIEPVFFAAGLRARPDLRAGYEARHAAYDEAFAAGDRARAAQAFTEMWGDGQAWEELSEKRREGFVRRIHLVATAAKALHEDTRGLLDDGRLERAASPALLITGAGSPPIIPAIADALAARLPNARRATIPGASHMLPLTHPGDVARQIRGLLEPS